MHDQQMLANAAALAEAGLTGVPERDLLHMFCSRLTAAGIPIARASVAIDTLHPVHEGRVFTWWRDANEDREILEYGRVSNNAEQMESWRRSPFFHLVETGATLLRCCIAKGDPVHFAHVEDLRTQGMTDYVAIIRPFGEAGTVGEMDCIYTSWTSDAEHGFADEDVAVLAGLMPSLSLAIKAASLQRIAGTLAETYLGRDAGRRVLSGKIQRGVADRLGAVLWWSDLRGFTSVVDTVTPEEIIPLLNDYSEAVISAIHEAGGDVLKLIGDGILAVFSADDPATACDCALRAEATMRRRVAEVNERRERAAQPVTGAYLALHLGDVFYGNVGSRDRLDFTVIGPAVNKVSRIAGMCRSADRDLLLSSAFVDAAPAQVRGSILSVGRYALRGFDEGEELFTILPVHSD